MSFPSPEAKPTNIRWIIVILLMGLVALAHFNRLSITVPASTHFIGPDKLSETQMGLVYSAFLLVYTLGMLPGGWLIDRVGPRRSLTGMGLGLGFCTALTGALGGAGLSIAAMFLPLVLIRGLAGATSVPVHPGAARAVSLWVPLRERSTANGLITAGAVVGMAVTYPGFGWLVDRLGWPTAFVVAGTTLMVFAAVWYVLSADAPAEHRWANPAERELVAGGESVPPRTRGSVWKALTLFRNRNLILLTLSYGALGYFQYMFFYWVEYYFNTELKLPKAESRQAGFTVTMAMAVGMAAGGWVSDRLSRRLGHSWGYRAMALLGMGLCALFGLLGTATTDPQEIIVCFSLAMGALGLCEGIFWTTAPALEKRNGALACALMNTGGNGIGMLAPIVTPILGEHYGWTTAIGVACAICGVGGLLWFGITSVTGEEPQPEPESFV